MKILFQWLLILLSITILFDYLFSRKLEDEKVLKINSVFQSGNNAGANSYYSYEVHTSSCSFSLNQEEVSGISEGEKVSLHTSPIFNEITSICIQNYCRKSSLTLFSEIIIPSLFIIVSILFLIAKNKPNNLYFVFLLILIIDLIYLAGISTF
jgi:hypothetical protein